MIYVLDTDHISLMLRDSAEAAPIFERLNRIAPDDYGTTVVSFEEQCRGWNDNINRARTPEARVRAYRDLRNCLHFYASISVWEYTPVADALVVTWEQARVRIGTKDLRIAAITVANGATLLTRNTRDFAKVPGLRFEDWTLPLPADA